MSAFDWPVYVQEVYPPMPLLPPRAKTPLSLVALAECAACAAPIPKAERACPIHEALLVAIETALRASLSDAPKFVAPSLRDDLARHLAPAAARAAWRLQFPPVHPQEAR